MKLDLHSIASLERNIVPHQYNFLRVILNWFSPPDELEVYQYRLGLKFDQPVPVGVMISIMVHLIYSNKKVELVCRVIDKQHTTM